jgi:hypothetical protein
MERLFNWVGGFWIVTFALTIVFRPLWLLLLVSSSLLVISGVTMVLGVGWSEGRTHKYDTRGSADPPARRQPKRASKFKMHAHQYGILLIFGGIVFGAGALVESDIPTVIPTAMLIGEAAAVTGFIWIVSVLILGMRR